MVYFNYDGEQINDEELLESLPEDVEEIETVFEIKGENDLWRGVFILICCSDQAATDLSKKEVISFKEHNLETELLSSMLVKKRFAMKAKNFKDDSAFKDKDNDRRLVLPSSKLSNDAAEALETHIRETRTGKSFILKLTTFFQVCMPGTKLFAISTLSHSLTQLLPLVPCRCTLQHNMI